MALIPNNITINQNFYGNIGEHAICLILFALTKDKDVGRSGNVGIVLQTLEKGQRLTLECRYPADAPQMPCII